MRSQVIECRLCPHCATQILVNAGRCTRCGRAVAATMLPTETRGRLQRSLFQFWEGWYVRQSIAHQALCPNCRMPLAHAAPRCTDCGWDRDPSRFWLHYPQMIWLIPICLILYATLLTTFLHMADPVNAYSAVNQYGYTHQEAPVKQFTSQCAHH